MLDRKSSALPEGGLLLRKQLRWLMAKACREFGADSVSLALPQKSQELLMMTVYPNTPGVVVSWIGAGHCYCDLVINEAREVAVSDLHRCPTGHPCAVMNEAGATSYLGAPVVVQGGEAIAALSLQAKGARIWSAEERKALRYFARLALRELEAMRPIQSAPDLLSCGCPSANQGFVMPETAQSDGEAMARAALYRSASAPALN